MNRLAFACLWLFVFVVPWELFITFPGFGTISRLIGLVAFGVGVLDALLRGRMRSLPAFYWLMLLFVLWSGLTIVWSIDRDATAERWKTYLQLTVLVWMIWELGSSPERQLRLLQAYVLGAAVSAIGTIAQYVSGTTVQTGRYAAAGFNPNDLGYTLVLGIPLAWYLALSHGRGILAWINRLYVPLGMTGVLLTASRGAFIPSLLALLVIPWTLPHFRLRTKAAMALLIALSFYAVVQIVPQSSWERLASTTTEIETGDFSSRGAFWRAGLQVFAQNPILGVGAGAFPAAVEPILGAGRAPHQTFLSVLVGQGIIGLALFLAVFVAAALPVLRMPPLPRKVWLVMLLTLGIGLQPRTWDYRKPLWVVLAVLAAQGAAARQFSAPAGAPPRPQAGAATPPRWYSRRRQHPRLGRLAG